MVWLGRCLLLTLMGAVSVQASVDRLLDITLSAPLDHSTFFARGLPHAWEKQKIEQPSWTGINCAASVTKPLKEPSLVGRMGIALGPEHPDPVGSFIFGGQVHAVISGKELDHMRERLEPSLQVTARGFFGDNSGALQNCELVFQAGSKIPGTKGWANSEELDLLSGDSASKLSTGYDLWARTGFLLGANFHVIPKVFRAGAFCQILGKSLGLGSFNPMLNFVRTKSVNMAKNAWAKIPRATTVVPGQPAQEVAKAEPEEEQKQEPKELKIDEPERRNLGLVTFGGIGEVSVRDEAICFGAIVRKTQLYGMAASDKTLVKPGIKEITFFARTGPNPLIEGLKLPEVCLNYSIVFDSVSWKPQKFLVGVGARIQF